MVKLDEKLVMAVLPANFHVDLAALKRALKAKPVLLESEEEFKDRFVGCETGAMPPFGNLYGLPVFADENLTSDKEIAFNAGTHRELIPMTWDDFKRLAEPRSSLCRREMRSGGIDRSGILVQTVEWWLPA